MTVAKDRALEAGAEAKARSVTRKGNEMSDNTAGSPGRPETKPMICPHCGAEAVRYYKDSHVRYDALEPTEDSVLLAGSTVLVIGYEKGDELICERCEKTIDLEGRDVQIVAPRFDLDLDALQHGFDAEYGVGREFPLAALPGGDLESFGEFAERVVSKAMHEWDAISAPGACSVRLLALFPFADRLLPAVQVRDRAWQLTGAPVSRDDLVTHAGVGLATGCAQTAAVLSVFAVDAANEILGATEAMAEFAD